MSEQSAAQNKKNILKELIEKGKRQQNVLTYQEIITALEELELDQEQISVIYDKLEGMGIDVIGDIDSEIEELQNSERSSNDVYV